LTGKLQSEAGVIHIIADRIDDLTLLLKRLSEDSTGVEALAHCDEVRRPVQDARTRPRHAGAPLAALLQEEPALIDELAPAAKVQAVMPRGRNFH
jgi:error-prone DNA polymerase